MIDTQKKFKEEFKDYWATVTSCPSFNGNKKDEKFLLLDALNDDRHIPRNKYNSFYRAIKQGSL